MDGLNRMNELNGMNGFDLSMLFSLSALNGVCFVVDSGLLGMLYGDLLSMVRAQLFGSARVGQSSWTRGQEAGGVLLRSLSGRIKPFLVFPFKVFHISSDHNDDEKFAKFNKNL